MPGVRWDKSRKAWRGAREAVNIIADILQRAGVVRLELESPSRKPLPPPWVKPHNPRLRVYQAEGVSWLIGHLAADGAALLADDMGIGKTAQAIAAIEAALPSCAVVRVIAPAIAVPHWRAQLAQWGGPGWALRWQAMSYEGFVKAKRKGLLHYVSALVIDEIHYISNPKAARSKAIAEWLAVQSPRPVIVGLSGTPMTVRPRDLWHPLDVLWPGRFGTKWQFEKRYCDGHYKSVPGLEAQVWDADGQSRLDELRLRLEAVMLRRTKSQVAQELPQRQRIVVSVELPKKARDSLAKAAAAIGWDGKGTGISSLLSQIEAYKIKEAVALASDVLASGSRPLILTTRKTSAEAVGAALGCPWVTGDVPPLQRRAELVGGTGAGAATIYSVTTGIDLLEFDVIIFAGLDWVPSTLLQAEARIHRLGQARPVTFYYLVGIGTLDEVVQSRVIERLDVTAAVLGTEDSQLAQDLGGGSDDELLSALFEATKQMGIAA